MRPGGACPEAGGHRSRRGRPGAGPRDRAEDGGARAPGGAGRKCKARSPPTTTPLPVLHPAEPCARPVLHPAEPYTRSAALCAARCLVCDVFRPPETSRHTAGAPQTLREGGTSQDGLPSRTGTVRAGGGAQRPPEARGCRVGAVSSAGRWPHSGERYSGGRSQRRPGQLRRRGALGAGAGGVGEVRGGDRVLPDPLTSPCTPDTASRAEAHGQGLPRAPPGPGRARAVAPRPHTCPGRMSGEGAGWAGWARVPWGGPMSPPPCPPSRSCGQAKAGTRAEHGGQLAPRHPSRRTAAPGAGCSHQTFEMTNLI